ncbi:hypothetical protein BB559_002968 [Furculomyces boomerangus]|uniref:FLYWCH-type domain-containing protein n=1 Tax=Furculomyces boomerangus TaxID=61424 RepID=A0A2T9YQB5_9FUNG|nr:hypothetical protein BB559_002968 [Furculomyces boomerangus]
MPRYYIVKNQKNKDSLVVNDFIFTNKDNKNKVIYWRCSTKSFKVLLNTGYDYKENDTIEGNFEHTHTRRARNNLLPQSVRNINDIDIPKDLRKTISNNKFYQYGPGTENYNNDNILIFFDNESVQNLKQNRVWCMDRTFKTAPEIFYQ